MSVMSDSAIEEFPYAEYLTPLGETKIDANRLTALKSYRRAIESLAETGSDFIFPNSTGFHAAVVLGTMIRHTKHRLRIYDDDLRGDLSGEFDAFNEVIPSLIKLAGREAALEIVVREGGKKPSKIYQLLNSLCKIFEPKISVRIASPRFKKMAAAIYEKDINFAVADDKAFRLEEFWVKDRTRRAICSFNQQPYAEKLNGIFDEEFANCKPAF